ncbi:MAG: DoxX family protein [Planctomycetaceae bacterium]
MGTQKKALTVAGWVISGLIGAGMTFSAVMKFLNRPEIAEQFVNHLGYPADLPFVLGVVELTCVVLYLIPQTAVLGAVVLTGYLGGAIATHVRVHDNFLGPAIGGILVWLALFLRDPRIRALLPFRRPRSTTPAP